MEGVVTGVILGGLISVRLCPPRAYIPKHTALTHCLACILKNKARGGPQSPPSTPSSPSAMITTLNSELREIRRSHITQSIRWSQGRKKVQKRPLSSSSLSSLVPPGPLSLKEGLAKYGVRDADRENVRAHVCCAHCVLIKEKLG